MVVFNIILMKRMLNETVNSVDPTVKSKCVTSPQVAPVFEITHFPTRGPSELPKGIPRRDKESRVMASSKVNFSKLTPEEQRERYINQKSEIKALKRRLKRYSADSGEDNTKLPGRALQQARDSAFELPGQKTLIENLCKAIVAGKLLPNTLGYNQICTILRDVLNVPYSNEACSLSLSDKRLNISEIEYKTYSKIPCTDSILLKIIGREKKEAEDPFTLLQLFSGPTLLSRMEKTSAEDVN
eukprot:TRINITY_DN9492_c0_g2_i1.p1 TRINITY_DN9492_c0_g2~~TRINITY_DN9492_c0_g2_i1.p1  ORF type:complete len:242 (+),score=36.49 TRINITY_DN9492_c0_g2_i1:214-939(+)